MPNNFYADCYICHQPIMGMAAKSADGAYCHLYSCPKEKDEPVFTAPVYYTLTVSYLDSMENALAVFTALNPVVGVTHLRLESVNLISGTMYHIFCQIEDNTLQGVMREASSRYLGLMSIQLDVKES